MDWNATPREITVFFIVTSEYLGATAEIDGEEPTGEFDRLTLADLSERLLVSIA